MSEGEEKKKLVDKSFFTALLLALVLSLLTYLVLPIWQVIILIGIVSGIIAKDSLKSFLAGFIGVFVGWGVLLGVQASKAPIIASANLLSQIMGLGESAGMVIIALTLVVGGIITGFSALVGAYLKKIV